MIDKLLTLLRVRGQGQRALKAGRRLLDGEVAHIVWVQPEDVRRGWGYYNQYADMEWSFTDCVSREVIERLGIRRAFAFDKHFRQFGILDVLP